MIKQVKVKTEMAVPAYCDDAGDEYMEVQSVIAYGTVDTSTMHVVIDKIYMHDFATPLREADLNNWDREFIASDLLNAALEGK